MNEIEKLKSDIVQWKRGLEMPSNQTRFAQKSLRGFIKEAKRNIKTLESNGKNQDQNN